MNYSNIRRTTILLGLGYAFLTLYAFISLNAIDGLEAASNVRSAFFVGFTLLTVGTLLIIDEHKYFKASFISFLCLDFLIVIMIVFMLMGKYNKSLESVSEIGLKVITTCNNAALVLANGLFTNGIKEVFSRRKSKKMYAYAMTMEYGVTGLILISTILSLIELKLPVIVSTSLNVSFEVVIQGSYSVFCFIIAHCLKEKHHKPK